MSAEALDVLKRLFSEVDGLIGASEGVTGYHLNGKVAFWEDLAPGGKFECLPSLKDAMAVIEKYSRGVTEENQPQNWEQDYLDLHAMHTELLNSDAQKRGREVEASGAAAIRTLEHLGYTYSGASFWRPPIGDAGKAQSLLDRIAQLEAERDQFGEALAAAVASNKRLMEECEALSARPTLVAKCDATSLRQE